MWAYIWKTKSVKLSKKGLHKEINIQENIFITDGDAKRESQKTMGSHWKSEQ